MRLPSLLAVLLALVVPASAATRLNVAIGADVNVVEVHKTLLGPGFHATASDVELNVVGTGTGQPRDLHQDQGAGGRGPQAVGSRRRAGQHGGGLADGEGRPALPLRPPDEECGAREGRGGEGGLRGQRRRLRGPDVPQPDRAGLRAVEGRQSAEVVRRAGRVGEGQSGPLRLQRHQGRGERSRLNHGLGLLEDRALQGADPGAVRQGERAGDPRGGHRVARLQQGRGDHQRQRGHARRAEPRRDLDGRGVDRPARGLEERGAHGPGGDPAPARPRPPHLPALPGGAARGGQPGGGRPLHRLHRDAGGAGQGHRGEVRLVPRRGRREGAAAHQPQKPRAALHRGERAGSRALLAPDADQGIPRPDQPGLRGDRPLTLAERALWAALCAPALAVLGAVFLCPLGASVVASFAQDGQWTLANYGTVARLYARDMAYTIGVAAAGTALTFLVAIPVCGWLRVRAYGPIEFLLKVPLFVPFVVVGHALRVFWSPYVPSFSSSWAGIAAALAWKHLGLAALLLLGAFRGTDDAYLEAAQQLGASTGRLTRDILVPMAGPALAVTGILIFSSMLASFSIPLMMGRGGGPQMLMIDVYYRYGQHGDFATASALGVVAYLLAMGAALVYVRRLTR